MLLLSVLLVLQLLLLPLHMCYYMLLQSLFVSMTGVHRFGEPLPGRVGHLRDILHVWRILLRRAGYGMLY